MTEPLLRAVKRQQELCLVERQVASGRHQDFARVMAHIYTDTASWTER